MIFEISKEDEIKILDWMSKLKPMENVGAIGGAFTYSFTPTGLGIVTTIERADGEKLDFTDYDLW